MNERPIVSSIPQDCELAQCPSSQPVPPGTKVPSNQAHKTQWRFGSWTQVCCTVTSQLFCCLLFRCPPIVYHHVLLQNSAVPAAVKGRGCATLVAVTTRAAWQRSLRVPTYRNRRPGKCAQWLRADSGRCWNGQR